MKTSCVAVILLASVTWNSRGDTNPPVYIHTNGMNIVVRSSSPIATNRVTRHPSVHPAQLPATNHPAGATPSSRATPHPEMHRIQVTSDSASASFGLHKVSFAGSLSKAHPVSIITPNNHRLSFRPTLLAYYDTASGQTVPLAEVQDCGGEVHWPDRVVYKNAFNGLNADVEYVCSSNSLEQNIILRQHPTAPEDVGLNPETTRLEIWTEWFDVTSVRAVQSSVNLRAGLTGADAAIAIDTALDFGTMKIVRGRAFKLGGMSNSVPVVKEWGEVKDKKFLMEAIDYKSIQEDLQTLTAALSPSALKTYTGREPIINELASSVAKPSKNPQMQLANAESQQTKGVVLDFTIIDSIPLPAGAIEWWPAGGDANDIVGGNNGIMMNGATFAAGEVGQGFSMDGVSSFVEIPYSTDPAGPFTIEFWMKADPSNPMGTMQGLVTGDFYGIEISPGWWGNNGVNFFISPDGGNWWNMISSANGGGAVVSSGEWHHIAGTYDGVNMQLYVDGQPWGNSYPSDPPSPAAEGSFMTFGSEDGRGCPDRYFNGVLDEVTIYSRALSPSEIQAIYDADGAGKNNPQCVTPPSNAIGWWSGDGNADDLVNANNGSLQGGATCSSGEVGRSFDLDGNSGYVEVPDNDAWAFGNNDFTVEFWVNFRSLPENDSLYYPDAIFVANDQGGGDQNKWIFDLGDGVLTLLTDDPVHWVRFVGQAPFSPDMNTWYHLALVRNGTAVTIYVNGVPAGTDTISVPIYNANAPLTIGQAEGLGYIDGQIDEMTIYNRALSDTEIATIYSAGGAGKCKTDVDSDGLPDSWERKYFGDLNQTANDDYDGDGVNNRQEYLNGTDPNTIKFSLSFPKPRTTSHNLTGSISITSGHAASVGTAVLPRNFLNGDRDFSTALWQACPADNHVSVMLPSQDGDYEIWVGAKGRANDSQITWQSSCVILDTTPPVLTLDTSGPGAPPSTVTGPRILLSGSSPEALSKIEYSVNGSASQPGNILDVGFNAATKDFGATTFECRNIQLQSGNNTITTHTWDLAGNQNSINKAITYNLPTTAPTISVTWPPNNADISGSDFVICGEVSDPSVSVVVSGDGISSIPAAVEPGSPAHFFAKGLPLLDGSHTYTITATDVAHHTSDTHITVSKSLVDVSLWVSQASQPVSSLPTLFDIGGYNSGIATSVDINGQPASFDYCDDDYCTWHADAITPGAVCNIPIVATIHLAGGGTVYAVANPDIPTIWYWSAVNTDDWNRKYQDGQLKTIGNEKDLWLIDFGGSRDYFSWAADGLNWPGEPRQVYSATFGGTFDETDVLQTWYCNFAGVAPGDPNWTTARENWHRRLLGFGLMCDTPLLSQIRLGMHQDYNWYWDYSDVAPSLLYRDIGNDGLMHDYLATASYSERFQRRLDTGGTKGQLSDMVLWFTVQSYESFYNGNREAHPWAWIPAQNYRLFGEQMYLEPANPADPNDLNPYTGHLIKALPPLKTFYATPTVENYNWYSTKCDVKRLKLDIDGDANQDGIISADDPDDPIEDLQPFGVLVRHNNDDDDANSVPDDEDEIINGLADASDLSELKLRAITLPDCAEYSLRLRLANPDGAAVDQVVRIFDKNDPSTAVPILGPGKTEYALPRTGLGVTMQTLKAQDISLWAEGITAGAGVQLYFDLMGPNGVIASDVLQLRVLELDLDIDSDNNNGLNSPDRSAAEDLIEDDPTKPGKYIAVNDGDSDGDGIPGFADGFNCDNANPDDNVSSQDHFVPIVLQLPSSIDLTAARLQISYNGSDPAGVTYSGSPTVWEPASGSLRIWKKDGNEQRNKNSANASSSPGDYVEPGIYADISKLGFTAGTRTVTFYVEAIRPSSSMGDQEITVHLDINGSGLPPATLADSIRCTAVRTDLDIDSDNSNALASPDRSDLEDEIEDINNNADRAGKFIEVNNNDNDHDCIPDYVDGFNFDGISGNADDLCTGEAFTPLILEIQSPIDLSVAKLRLTYDASDPTVIARSANPPYTYTLPNGHLRIWKKNGFQARNKNSANSGGNPGDYVPAETYNDLSKLGLYGGSRTVTLYVEGIKPSASVADQEIRVEVDPDGSGPTGWICSDAVRCTILQARLKIDSDNDKQITDKDDPIRAEEPGCVIAKDLEGDAAGKDDLKPLQLSIEPALARGKVTLSADNGVKIWTTAAKTVEVTLPKEYDPPSTLPATLYVDGVARWTQAGINLKYEDQNAIQVGSDKVKVLVTETPSWAPAKKDAVFVWASLKTYQNGNPGNNLGWGDATAFENQIKDQGWPHTVWYEDTTGDSDADFGSCSLSNYKNMPQCGIFTVVSHGEIGWHPAVYAERSAAGRAAILNWIGSEANMQVDEWLPVAPPDPNAANWPAGCYVAHVNAAWLAANWAATANANKLIAMWSICYSAAGSPSVKEAAGGRWRSGYIQPTTEGEAIFVNNEFLSRLNGSSDSGQKRTAGEAWDGGSGYQYNGVLNVKMDGNNWTTLCPSPMLQKEVFPASDPGQRYGWGCIIFDTYMNENNLATEALTKVSGSSTYGYNWLGKDNAEGYFIVGFGYNKTDGQATTMRAVGNKCTNSDPDGGRRLDANRVKPNDTDAVPDNKQWTY